MNPVLTIDPEFEAKCPPLTEDELSQLEENILEEGLVLMPLIVWNDTIVDGHNRYRIAQAHPGIGFREGQDGVVLLEHRKLIVHQMQTGQTVSYTHLTLPTILRV